MSDLEQVAEEYLKYNRAVWPWHYRNDEPEDADNWVILAYAPQGYGHTRLDESNYETLSSDMTERFPKDTAYGEHGNLLVRVYAKTGGFTEAWAAAVAWLGALEDYPVADDEDYSRREHEAQLEAIEEAAGGYTDPDAPEDWAAKVFSWLWDNDQATLEPVDDDYWVKPEAAVAALVALDMHDVANLNAGIQEIGDRCASRPLELMPRGWDDEVERWLLTNAPNLVIEMVLDRWGEDEEYAVYRALRAMGLLKDECLRELVGRKLSR